MKSNEACRTESRKGLKYIWKLPSYSQEHEAEVRSIVHETMLSFPIAQTLYRRGYGTAVSVRAFLTSSDADIVAHPSRLKGSLIAAERIITALKNNDKMLVFGDYDVDGVTSSAVMLASLIPLGAQINYFLPHRERDGYGLSCSAVERAHKSGYKLIITVDNGIAAYEPAQRAKELGIDLIITDHHRPQGEPPVALCVVNPAQEDCTYPFKKFAGVGVIFKLMCLVYELLGLKDLPPKLYELLTLGTIADVVPLIHENRFWVAHGLSKINRQFSPAMLALMENAELKKERLSSLDVGFMIAPQINALGRLDDSRDAVRFLISADQEEVFRVARTLKSMNEERKKIDQKIYAQVEQSIKEGSINIQRDLLIVAADKEWPPGVIGLVAGKLMHNYGRPTFLFHLDERNALAKGSCRSIPEFNAFDALTENKDLLLSFGGHSSAAGLKVSLTKLPLLKERLKEALQKKVSANDLAPKLLIDSTLELPEVTHKFLGELEQLEPFGHQNPQPLFIIHDVCQIKEPQLLKEQHVKCTLFAQGIIKPTIFFNRPDLYPILQALGDQPFDLACHIMKNEWQGTVRIELQGIDIAIKK